MNPFKLGDIMKQAKEMQAKVQEAQKELADAKIVGQSGAGLVKVAINGNGEALALDINEEVFQEDRQVLHGLILAAINDANLKRENLKKEKMSGFLSGMGLPEEWNL